MAAHRSDDGTFNDALAGSPLAMDNPAATTTIVTILRTVSRFERPLPTPFLTFGKLIIYPASQLPRLTRDLFEVLSQNWKIFQVCYAKVK